MATHFSETLGGRAREAHVRQIELALVASGSGKVDRKDIVVARIKAVRAMEDLIAEVYKGLEPQALTVEETEAVQG